MNKKLVSIIMGLAVVLTAINLPMAVKNAYAESGISESIIECYEADESIELLSVDDFGFDYANEDLFEMYAGRTLGMIADISTYSVSYSYEQLTDQEKVVYDFLKREIEKIANGDCESANIEVPISEVIPGFQSSFTKSQLGLSTITSGSSYTDAAKTAFTSAIDSQLRISSRKIVNVLLNDCPYEFYWFMKTEVFSIGHTAYKYGGDSEHIEIIDNSLKFTATFVVDPIYRKVGGDKYSIDTAKTGAAKQTAEYASDIVAAASGMSDYEKLVYYKNEICKLNVYNKEAASSDFDDSSTIAPWQIIYVFDRNPETNVVCEGYAKAFAYLCDLTTTFTNNNIRVYTVSGDMTEELNKTGPHMWNVIHMGDNENYLIDVTNCDGVEDGGTNNSAGYPDELFLRGSLNKVKATYSDGTEVVIGYGMDIDGQGTYFYIYDEETLDSYSWSDELALSGTDFELTCEVAERPVIESQSCSTVTLKPIEDYEYSIDNTNWQESNTFSDLTDGTTYAFYQRKNSRVGIPSASNSVLFLFVADHDFDNGVNGCCAGCDVKNIGYDGITVTVNDPVYTGSSVVPTVVLKDGETTLEEDKDYTVSVTSEKNVKLSGDYELSIIGKGAYANSIDAYWNISKADPNLSASSSSYNKTIGDRPFYLIVNHSGEGVPSYESDNTSVATVDASGRVTIVGDGTANIKVTLAESQNYTVANITIAVNVDSSKKNASLSVPAEITKVYGDESFRLEVYYLSDGTLSYSSNNTKVAVVDSNGFVNIKGVGTAIITVSLSETDGYLPDSKTVIINVGKGTHWDPHNFGVDNKETCEYCNTKNIAYSGVKVFVSTPTYNGEALVPEVVVKAGDVVLTQKVDYKLIADPQAYIKPNGNYELTIEGIGAYAGIRKVEWNLSKAFYEDNSGYGVSYSCDSEQQSELDLKEAVPSEIKDPSDTLSFSIKSVTYDEASSITNVRIAGDILSYNVNKVPSIPVKSTKVVVTVSSSNYDDYDKTVEIYRTYCEHVSCGSEEVFTMVPNCESGGFAYQRCNNCHGMIDREYYIPGFGHDWEEHYTVDRVPTCDVPGAESRYCARCGEKGYEREIPALGHKWEKEYSWDKVPTCTEPGGKSIHCSVCEATKDGFGIGPLSHDWDEGVITKPSTFDTKGIITYTCRRDSSHTMTDEVPTLGVLGDVVDEDISDFSEEDYTKDELRITGVSAAVYTGSAVTFDLRVYKGNKLLKEGTDYSIKYQNNKNAGSIENPSSAPAFMITGKGTYSDIKQTVPFEIAPYDLSNNSRVCVSNEIIIGKGVRPVPTVTLDGKKLKPNVDYDVDGQANFEEPGSYEISVNGKGNYTGSIVSKVTVLDDEDEYLLMSKAKVTGYTKSFKYNAGKPIEQNVTGLVVKIGKVQLSPQDYTVSYINNTDIGTASMIIKASDESDKIVGEKVVTFKIAGTPISKAKASYEKNHTYKGKTINPVVRLALSNGTLLKEGVDYTVTYAKNVNAGTASIIIMGKGAYYGTVKKAFKIIPVELTSPQITASVIGLKKNDKGETIADVQVVNNGKLLTKNIDYLVSYKNNKMPALATDKKAPTVVIKGKGNYSKKTTLLFDITE